MKDPPNEWMLFMNLMFGNVSTTHFSLRVSGSEYSDGHAYVSLAQLVDAPKYPSHSESSALLRFMATPLAMCAAGSLGPFSAQRLSNVLRWPDASYIE